MSKELCRKKVSKECMVPSSKTSPVMRSSSQQLTSLVEGSKFCMKLSFLFVFNIFVLNISKSFLWFNFMVLHGKTLSQKTFLELCSL